MLAMTGYGVVLNSYKSLKILLEFSAIILYTSIQYKKAKGWLIYEKI